MPTFSPEGACLPTEDRRVRHDAIFYDDEFDFVTAVLPFVRGGIDAGEVVLVNTGTHSVTPLLRAMFADEKQVVFADRAYSTPAATLDGYHRTIERGLAAGVRGYRAVGHIDFESSRLPWQEWLRYEAAVNRVFAGQPLHALCPYDTSKTSAEILDPILRTHTGLVTREGWRANEEYVDPGELVTRDSLVSPPHPLQATAPRMVIEPGHDLMELRIEVYAATLFTDIPRLKVDDFVKAVGEVVTNAHKHGGVPVDLRLWAADTALVCTVTDQGPGIDDPFAGYTRPSHPSQGLGLWAARQLCDILDYRRGPDGFTVRVATFT